MGQASTFIGREGDLKAIAGLLSESRVVTIVGPAGIGKTRLASELSADSAIAYPGGVFLVELSGMTPGEDLAGRLWRQLDVESLDALLLRSAGDRTLIVLDNCESALSAAGEVVSDLVTRSEAIVVLATSRSPLYAVGEHIVPLAPLDLPDSDDPIVESALEADAVKLFLDRCRAAGAAWANRPETIDADAVGRLVNRLDGLPLAIELAAARSRMLGPAELANMLDRQLDILSLPGRDGGRHHSLRTAIHGSYEPLGEDLRTFFRRLSVISAPFPLELANTVADEPQATVAETLDKLTELVDASLVEVRPGPGGQTQFRLLDSIRAFGREQLDANGELASADERYIDAMVAIADDIVASALTSFTPEVLGRIRDQFVHLSKAISLCLVRDQTPARVYRMFIPFYGPTGARAEVAELAGRILERWTEPAELEAEALAVMGTAKFLNGQYEDGAALAARAVDHPDATFMAKLISNRTLGYMASLDGDARLAATYIDRALEEARPFSEAFARELRISRAVVIVDPSESPDAIEELEAIGRESAHHDEMVNIVWSAVATAYHRALLDDLPGAKRAAQAAMSVADRTGMAWSVSTAHRALASALAAADGWSAARPHFLAAVDATRTVGDVEGMAMALRAAAGAAMHVGDRRLAEGLWAAIPPVRGLPVVRSIFHDLEEQLLAELGPPTPLDGATLLRTARALLAEPDGDGSAGNGSGRAVNGGSRAAAEGDPSGERPERASSPRVVRFGDCELDLAMHELRRDGQPVHVEPQVFDVLAFLVERRGSVVTKNELLDEVWGDRFVSVAALSSRIAAARRATGDDGKAQRIIRTVHGKGFSFVARID